MNEKINQWIAFIDGERKELVEVAEKKNKTLQKAREEMNYLTGDAAIRRLTELREKWDMDYNSGISYAEKKGKKEERIKIAKSLIKMEMPIEKVIEATELTKEEIEQLKKEI